MEQQIDFSLSLKSINKNIKKINQILKTEPNSGWGKENYKIILWYKILIGKRKW